MNKVAETCVKEVKKQSGNFWYIVKNTHFSADTLREMFMQPL